MNTPSSLRAIRRELTEGHFGVSDLVDSYLKRIEETRDLNIFLEVFEEESRRRAEEIQEKIDSGRAGKLAGAVIAIKDNLCYAGHRVGAASKILEGFESVYTATAVQRLLDEDVIIIGRVNCDEFAMGGSNEKSAYGAVKNPVNPSYVPGGSSGGSAAAVAAGCCLAALGSDTGGSIRQPASFTGVVGVKPTYGRVSRHGLIAFASSFDQIGPLTTNVEDAALLLELMSGEDPMDSTSMPGSPADYGAESSSEQPIRIAYLEDCLQNEAIDPEVKRQTEDLIEKLKQNGHVVEPVSLEGIDHLVPTYYVLTTAEASSNLARYDGIHFGYRSGESTDIESTYKKSRSEGFGAEVKRRIMLGTFVLSAGYYDAYYGKALKVRRVITEKTKRIFEKYDLLLSPTTPSTAFQFGRKSDNPIEMYVQDIFTVHANLVGNPAMSLPVFTHSDKGLPFGIQLMAGAGEEKRMLDFAHNFLTPDALEKGEEKAEND